MAKNNNFETKFGLPEEVKFCKKCIISNQRPNSEIEFKHTDNTKKKTIYFDENGVCDACNYAEQKKGIDWKSREKELIEICDKYRKTNGEYDCLVPGSGGKDSFYASHLLKYKYNMHPLTVTWAPHIYTPWGYENFQSWIHSGFDNYLMTPNGLVHRLLTRIAVEKLFHPFQPFMLGQKSIAPKIAAMMNIPLIFYGEHSAEYGNPISETKSKNVSKDYFAQDKNNTFISGVSIKELVDEYGLSLDELEPYQSLNPEILERKKINFQYLGYYIPWHPQTAYYYSVEKGNFKAAPERTAGTYSKYNSIDDKIDDFHFYTYYIKFGLGRASYDASQEIRNGDITRDEGINLVRKYDGEFPSRFSEEIFQYLSIEENQYPVAHKKLSQELMTKDYFFHLADKFRSPHLWLDDNGKWELRNKIWKDRSA